MAQYPARPRKLEYTHEQRYNVEFLKVMIYMREPTWSDVSVFATVWGEVLGHYFASSEGYGAYPVPLEIYDDEGRSTTSRIHVNCLEQPDPLVFKSAAIAIVKDSSANFDDVLREVKGFASEVCRKGYVLNKSGIIGGIVALGSKAKFYTLTFNDATEWEVRQKAVAIGSDPYEAVDVLQNIEQVHNVLVAFKKAAVDA